MRTNRYTFDQLAEIYNLARVDYIVPMPMNGRRMQEYVQFYNIDLDYSFIALNEAREPTGIGMLGVRGQRAWITRLGVIPTRRGGKVGQSLMLRLLDAARELGVQHAQLEVIEGNEPAHRLFTKLGFTEKRRLLVIRRPPSPPPALMDGIKESPLDAADVIAHLDSRPPGASWIDETVSLLNAGGLEGLRVESPYGTRGWIVYRLAPFQISHVVMDAPDTTTAEALLTAMHNRHPQRDTKIENLPADHPFWSVYQSVGYVETFRRIEMHMPL